MGVDFFPCDRCGETICDCGSWITCNGEDCGRRWCSVECACEDGYIFDSEEDENDAETCNFCRNEEAEDSTLLHYLLTRYNLTREQVLKEWSDEHRNNPPDAD